MADSASLLPKDPRPWLLQSDEPAARWVALALLSDRPADDAEVAAARAAVLRDPLTQQLIERLPDWETEVRTSGHESPRFAPNLLNLLADMGLRGGDDPRIEALLDAMLRHQDESGRFASYCQSGRGKPPAWGAMLCDNHAVTEVLIRYGRGDDPRTQSALRRMAADLTETAQGAGWPCLPHPVSGFRGPGRKGDFCPMVTLQALRTFSRLPPEQRPHGLLQPARTVLCAWLNRGTEQPYMFGHGVRFKRVKWPALWYSLYWVLDALGRYPELWSAPAERQAMAEMAACLIAYNFDAEGRVTPRSCYQGFEAYSFGQKKLPSPFATARLAVVLRRLEPLSAEIRQVDVLRLGSSKGGKGVPVPPGP